MIRDRSQTLMLLGLYVYMIFYGVDPYFHVKKRGPDIFKIWKGAPKIEVILFAPGPLTSVCERSLNNSATVSPTNEKKLWSILNKLAKIKDCQSD